MLHYLIASVFMRTAHTTVCILVLYEYRDSVKQALVLKGADH